MVQGRINVVDSNGVDTELLHEGSITETTGTIAQRVRVRGGTKRVRSAWLIAGKSVSCVFPALESSSNARHTDNLKTVAGDVVDKVCTLDLDILYR